MKKSLVNCFGSSDERILFVPEIVAFGGGERLYLSLLGYLNSKGILHRLVSYHQLVDVKGYANWPLKVEAITSHHNPFLKALALKRRFASRNEDVPVLLVGLQAAMHAAAFGLTNYSVIILDTPSLMAKMEYKGLRKLFKGSQFVGSEKLTSLGLKRARHVVTNTIYLADEIETLYGIRPLVSYPGVTKNPLYINYRIPNRSLRLLSVCRLEKTKRLDWIIRSLSVLQRETSADQNELDWRLDVVGTGSLQTNLEALASDLGIRERIIFHGHVADEELEKIYSQANVFLMPAVQGYGLPALEALAHKIPVLMHRESGVSEILNGNPWVEVIDGDGHTLTNGLRRIIKRVMSGKLSTQPLPLYPTEAQWAEELCRLCGWS